MKKLLLFIFSVFLFISLKSQVVFCPPGAQWKYLFQGFELQFYYITYTNDSIVDSETVKVLKYNSFYSIDEGSYCRKMSFIKQEGDTVFIRNCQTRDTWEILYNFAALPGQHWTTTLKDTAWFPYLNLPVTHTITVNSVNTVTINNLPLKKLTVSNCFRAAPDTVIYCSTTDIIERLGCEAYLFPFYIYPIPSYDYIFLNDFLCYKDNIMGTATMSQKGCNYDVGISENIFNNEELKIYPQPANNKITLELSQTNASKNYEIQIVNIFGQPVLSFKEMISNSKAELDLGTLQNGVYVLYLLENNKPVATRKIIKQ